MKQGYSIIEPRKTQRKPCCTMQLDRTKLTGTEFLRCQQPHSYSRNYTHFMGPQTELLQSQQPVNDPYPKSD
jgi:hypothetical protein